MARIIHWDVGENSISLLLLFKGEFGFDMRCAGGVTRAGVSIPAPVLRQVGAKICRTVAVPGTSLDTPGLNEP